MTDNPYHYDAPDDFLPNDLRTENEILKLKMMAELGATFGVTDANIPPQIEKTFLNQVYAFEKNFAAGVSKTFGETAGAPPLPEGNKVQVQNTEDWEHLVLQAHDFYKTKNIDVHFEFDYPAETRYRFLVDELPTLPNHFGQLPGMMIGVQYEEYHPNHVAEIERSTNEFIEALKEMNAEKMQYSLSPIQYLPEGPYDTQTLIQALYHKFLQIEKLDDFDCTVLETSYDISTSSQEEEATGMGYAEGLIKFEIFKKNGERKTISGPFKFYFHYEYETWSIIYMIFPGIKYPSVTNLEGGNDEEQ